MPLNQETNLYSGLNQRQRDEVNNLQKQFATENKADIESYTAIEEISNNLDLATRNEISAAQLGARVATLFENGRLTDEDVLRYTRRRGIPSRIEDMVEDIISGTITPGKAEAIRESLSTLASERQSALKKRALQKANVFQSRYGVQSENVAPLIYGGFGEQSKDPQIDQYARQHNLDYNTAAKIIQNRRQQRGL